MNPMITKALAVAVLGLAIGGCASASKRYDEQGREVYDLDCSGWLRSWAMCQEKAGELCGPRGYTIISRATEPVYLSGPITSGRTMIVTCGPEKEPTRW